ncbi:MAG: SAM-dependent methyltransferase, partial [Sciscionella sp.]|nr:SAM-dependent methyltransferase [Sciscionella sp.]
GIPPNIDVTVASPSRMYDYYLGGGCHFESDRELAKQVISMVPEVPAAARANKAFLGRATRYCLAHGVRQFIDIGAGIAGVSSTHAITQRIAPEAKIAYVDKEGVAVAHNELLLQGNDNATVIQADVLHPEDIFDNQELREMIDFRRPIAVLLGLVLPWISDAENPAGVLASCAKPLLGGGYLIASQITADGLPDDVRTRVLGLYDRSTTPVASRAPDTLREWLSSDGLTLVDPGVVFVSQWRPEEAADAELRPERDMVYGGVAAVPARG